MSSCEPGLRPNYRGLSPVDLGAIFWRRSKLFAVVFLLGVALSLVFAFSRTVKFEYTSVYQLGKVDYEQYIEAPKSVSVHLEEVLIPEASTSDTPFVRVNSGSGDLITLKTVASKEEAEQVEDLHNRLLTKIDAIQNRKFSSRKDRLNKALENVERAQKKADDGGSTVMDKLILKRDGLQESLLSLEPGRIISTSQRGTHAVGLLPYQIVVLGSVLAIMLGFCCVFLAEYCARVRRVLLSKDFEQGV